MQFDLLPYRDLLEPLGDVYSHFTPLDSYFEVDSSKQIFMGYGQNHKYEKVVDVINSAPYKNGSYIEPAEAIVGFSNCVISTSSGSMLYRGDFIKESFPGGVSKNYYVQEANRLKSSAVLNIDQACLCFSRSDRNNYFHWLVQILPSLYNLCKIYPSLPVLFPKEKLNNFQLESLSLLGIDFDRFLCVDGVIRSKLIIRNSVSMYDRPNAIISSKALVVAALIEEALSIHKSRYKKIYLSRSDTDKRKLVNEDEIERYFESIGFDIIVPSKYSYSDQVRIFSKAQVVVAPHGAGLTNILYAPSGCKVIELMPNFWTSNSFFAISQRQGHEYFRVYGAAVQGEDVPPIARHWIIPIERIQKALKFNDMI